MEVVHFKLFVLTSAELAKLGSKNLHNLHNLLNIIIFCSLLAREVSGLRPRILHYVQHVHRGKLTDLGDGGLIELQTIAAL